jgi:hypothetical protein
MRLMARRTWIVLTLGLAACEGDAILARADLEVSPLEIDFGEVATEESRTAELFLRNLSRTAPLRLTHVALAEGSSPAFTLGGAPREIAPAEELVLMVEYTADDGESDAGQIVIESDASSGPRVLVPLRSSSTRPVLSVRPERLELGNLAAGARARGTIEVENRGLALLEISRWSIRTTGFLGEACRDDGDCRQGRCATAAAICSESAAPTESAPIAARGFRIVDPTPRAIRARGVVPIEIEYAPGADDRGGVQLVIESNDPERRFFTVPVVGRPDDLPPVAALGGSAPDPIGPGAEVRLDGRASFDPEGSPLEYLWRFVRRPEGSRAELAGSRSSTTSFMIDLPGAYVAALEVRDSSGLTSTNDARFEVEAEAGHEMQVFLQWNNADSDLDLHLVAPGWTIGSAGDCFQDNPTPDWPPMGAGGDPSFDSTSSTERATVLDPAAGTYTIVVRVASSSPRGSTTASLALFLDGVEAAHFEAILPTGAEQWDVATISRPSGRLVSLGTIR